MKKATGLYQNSGEAFVRPESGLCISPESAQAQPPEKHQIFLFAPTSFRCNLSGKDGFVLGGISLTGAADRLTAIRQTAFKAWSNHC